MSNKETLNTYNNRLAKNNLDLASVLETINKLPEASSGASVADKPNLNVYVQPNEPEDKTGLWLATNNKLDYLRYINPHSEFNTLNVKVDSTQTISYRFVSGVAVGSDIYSFGGRPNSTSDRDVAFKYNIHTKECTTISSLPTAISFPGVAHYGDYIYIVGGRTGTTNKLKGVYKYDIINDVYTTLPDIPTACENASVSIKDDYMYITSPDLGTSILKYSITTGSCTTIDASVTPYFSCMYNDKLYLFRADGTNIYAHEFDLQSNTLRNIASIKSKAHIYGKCLQDGCMVYLINSYSPYSITTFNLATGQITQKPVNGIDVLHYCVYAFIDNCIYTLGGFNNDGNVYDVYKIPVRSSLNFNSNVVTLFMNGDFSNKYKTNIKYDLVPAETSFWDIRYYEADKGINDTIPIYYGDGTQWIKFKN